MILSAEIQLLLDAIHVDPKTSTEMCAAQLRLARTNSPSTGDRTGIDWSLFHELAVQHNVAPLVYSRLRQLPTGEVASQALSRLKETALTLALRNERLLERLLQVSDLLSMQGISVVPFKGATLAFQAYGDLALRQFMDIDLLIRPEDFQNVFHLLVETHWQPDTSIQAYQMNWYLRGQYHLRFLKEGDPLEIHWVVSERSHVYPIHPETFWQNLDTVNLSGREVSVLSPENNFLTQIIHGTSNQWQKLKWVADLAFLGRSFTDSDWEVILKHATRFGYKRALLVGCDLAQRLIGLALPTTILVAINRDKNTNQLASYALANALSTNPRVDSVTNNRFFLNCRERLSDRIYYIIDQSFIPKQADWQAIVLPARLYPVYFFLRPVRLVHKFVPIRSKPRIGNKRAARRSQGSPRSPA